MLLQTVVRRKRGRKDGGARLGPQDEPGAQEGQKFSDLPIYLLIGEERD